MAMICMRPLIEDDMSMHVLATAQAIYISQLNAWAKGLKCTTDIETTIHAGNLICVVIVIVSHIISGHCTCACIPAS